MQGTMPDRPHVLTITDTIGRGGAEQIAFTLNRALDRERFRRSLCLTRDQAYLDPSNEFGGFDRLARLRADGVEVVQLHRHSSLNLFAWLPLIRFIRAQRVDVIHAHKFGSNVWGVLIGALTGVRVIIAHEHTWSFEGQRLRQLIDRRIVSRLADAVVAVSHMDRRRMIEVVGMPADRVVFIANGIAPLPPGDGSLLRREVGIPHDAPVLVSVANLRPQKALDVMLRAVAIVRRRFPDVRLLLAGGGDRTTLQALADELDISAAIVFLGVRGDVANVLAAGDVAVSSSDFEGSPLAAMEYLAAGLPVVATDVGGMPDLVHQRENGLLVPRRDPEALAEAIGELLSDPARAREMGSRGRERQREEFSLEAMVRRVQDLYLEHLGLGGAPGTAPGAAQHEGAV
jgi:glycosyltransferase involved in cell wall biosynthesis